MSRRTREPKLDALLPPILALIEQDPPNAYSAHQKALTTTARLVQSGHGPLAIEILSAAARELLKRREAASGSELGVRMIEIMVEVGVDVSDASRATVTQLLALTPPAGPWRKKLADAAVKWSAQTCPAGDPSLNQYLGELNYKDRLFEPAEQYLLNAGKRDSATLLADMLFEWGNSGHEDPGAYAARGVLPFLAISPPNVLAATSFLQRYLSLLAAPSSPQKDSFIGTVEGVQLTTWPAVNFLQLAVLTVQRAPAPGTSAVQARGMDGGVARDWQQLVARYRRLAGSTGLLAQKEVVEAIDAISTGVFLIPPPRGGNDMLQNLMGSLFGGGMGGMGTR
ncbi:hypothetical protein CcaverHIS002_0101090 [Cutaneotrichosporon cavernicola]|uniref:Cytoplasmic protein n=1 Tax=Cutaneotrichosporon cavernicola TaxID=279322 RepID=A0AA48I0Q2_9TREE|nr:uncharacterized protein CcaverHIS019_0101070 [Cutaneotrichosporon cavernicola]BEI79580.1 hypothetical protein CcaverHIS002_0101090 [Cutaneotrichosporon cavernicola]BEI87389.1 hypothetical protein CcaverHIS019_0101070 [Cutaneotrichosporon cavernicola]BEI95158.1 hypothetical protein CcaverHIS631_0101070 [Cutaneotrichosporon cavernicola]BEJ02932.1 hypothetical protein CcaverHIS641_0101070 [Cutaneotrichosporon cavernicola]